MTKAVGGRQSIGRGVPSDLPWTWHSGVYFIYASAHIKIGYSWDVRKRLRDILANNPAPPDALGFIPCTSCADAIAMERELHERFAGFRVGRREWFLDDQSIRDYIREFASRWPVPAKRDRGAI